VPVERKQIGKGETLVVFRAVPVLDANAPEILTWMTSNSGRGMPRRGAELEHPELHCGVSVTQRIDQLSRAVRLEYAAKLHITREHDVLCTAPTRTGHLTLWGDPERLVSAIVRITPREAAP
jgi:hypothetical protein